MELQRQFPISLLDVFDGGTAGHPQNLVEVPPAGEGAGGKGARARQHCGQGGRPGAEGTPHTQARR